MKNKLKYLLIIGTALSVANGGMGVANLTNETKTIPHTLEISNRTVLSEGRTNSQRTNKYDRAVKGLEKHIDILNKRIKNLELLILEIYLHSGLTLTPRQKTIEEALVAARKARTTHLELQSCLNDVLLTPTQKSKFIGIFATCQVQAETSCSVKYANSFKEPQPKRLNESLIKEAQQNCLGKVTDVSNGATDGKFPIAMTPSTKPKKSQSQQCQGIISPIESSIDADDLNSSYTPRPSSFVLDDSFRLPSPANETEMHHEDQEWSSSSTKIRGFRF